MRERIRLVTKRATEYGAINRMLLKYNIQGFDRNEVKHLSEKDMHELYHHPANEGHDGAATHKAAD